MSTIEVARAPSPWVLKGVSYTFFHSTPFSKEPIPLPPASQAPLEADTPGGKEQAANFHGGAGSIMIVRYDSSPAGPYDELIYIPGLMSRPESPTSYYNSTARIYVSTLDSVLNGRYNWSIPKHLAEFSFTPLSSSSTLLVVSTPGGRPFFKATLDTSSRFIPSFPFNSNWLDNPLTRGLSSSSAITQPPIPDYPEGVLQLSAEDGSEAPGASSWLRIEPKVKGWVRLGYLGTAPETEGEPKGAWEGFGDGVGFPKVNHASKVGVKIDFSEMLFGVPARL